jgi:hypothetical protein
MKKKKIIEALTVLKTLGLPREQQNERSSLSLLALLDLTPGKDWSEIQNPLIGITPIMDWMRTNYSKKYKPNTRETVRRQTMHQFVSAGVAVYNPDDPSRPVNSPNAVYQISPSAMQAIQAFNTSAWNGRVADFLKGRTTLIDQYAQPREMKKVRVGISGVEVVLSPGKHSQLIKSIVEDFGGYFVPKGKHSQLIKSIVEDFGGYFVPKGKLVYAGDTGNKHGYTDACLLKQLGIELDGHGKMPDVVLYSPKRKWLFLIEAVTSHGSVDGKRHQELKKLFSQARAGLVYVTAFSTRMIMSRYIRNISWETEVWVAEAPTHLIHLDGSRFLGPYSS